MLWPSLPPSGWTGAVSGTCRGSSRKLDVDLLVSPGVVDVAGPRLQMRPVAGLPLIHVEKPQYNGAKHFQKRLLDVVFSGAVLLCALPVIIVVAIAVKATSKGPIFYRSERIGLDGRAFEMIKFRTMINGADSMVDKLIAQNESKGGVLFKIRNDPRVTPIVLSGLRTYLTPQSQDMVYSLTTFFTRLDSGAERGSWLSTGEWEFSGAGVDGELGAVAGDAEVGVLDVDGDDLAGVGASDAQSLAGDHDDAVGGDLALDADRAGGWGGSWLAAMRAPRSLVPDRRGSARAGSWRGRRRR